MSAITTHIEVDRPPAGTGCIICQQMHRHFCPAVVYHPNDPEAPLCQACLDNRPCSQIAARRNVNYEVFDPRRSEVAPSPVRSIPVAEKTLAPAPSLSSAAVELGQRRPGVANWDAIIDRLKELDAGQSVKLAIPADATAERFQNNLRSILCQRKETAHFKFGVGMTAQGLVIVTRKGRRAGIILPVPSVATEVSRAPATNEFRQSLAADPNAAMRSAWSFEEFLEISESLKIGETMSALCPEDETLQLYHRRVCSALNNRKETRMRRYVTHRIDKENRIVIARDQDRAAERQVGYKLAIKNEARQMIASGMGDREVSRKTGLARNTVIRVREDMTSVTQSAIQEEPKSEVIIDLAPEIVAEPFNPDLAKEVHAGDPDTLEVLKSKEHMEEAKPEPVAIKSADERKELFRKTAEICRKEMADIDAELEQFKKQIAKNQQTRDHLAAALEGLEVLCR